MGIVHFQDQIADLVWDTKQDLAHTQLNTPNPSVVGTRPHQLLKITAPWETADDDRSYAVRLYTYDVAVTSTFGNGYPNYAVVSDNRPWVGVGIAPGCPACQKARNLAGKVDYLYPGSPPARHSGWVTSSKVCAALRPPYAGAARPCCDRPVARFYPGDQIRLNVERNSPSGRRVRLGQWAYNQGEFDQLDGQLGVYLSPM